MSSFAATFFAVVFICFLVAWCFEEALSNSPFDEIEAFKAIIPGVVAKRPNNIKAALYSVIGLFLFLLGLDIMHSYMTHVFK